MKLLPLSLCLFLSISSIACSSSDSGNPADVAVGDSADSTADLPGQDVADSNASTDQNEPDSGNDVADLGAEDVTQDVAEEDVTPDSTPLDTPDSADTASYPWSVTCGDVPIIGPQGDQVTPACKECVDTTCCTQAEACAANTDCMAMRVCMAECSDSTCIEGCWNQYPAAQTVASAFTKCRSEACIAFCSDTKCFGAVEAVEPEKDEYVMTMHLATTPDGVAVAGATVRFCPTGDVMCENPVSTTTSSATGDASLAVPSAAWGVDGYLEISGPTIVTQLYHGFRYTNIVSLLGNYYSPMLPAIFTPGTINLIASLGEFTVDEGDAIVFFSTRGCAETYMANVAVSTPQADANTKVIYMSGGMPSTVLTKSSSDASGAIFNLPTSPSTVTINASFEGTVFSTLQVVVRPNAITSLDLVPTP